MNYSCIKKWQEKPELHKLHDLPDPPKKLFCRGTYDPKIFQKCSAVVGSRRMTNYGRQVIDQIVPKLVLEGKTIVSGFMYGVDQYAHDVTIQNGGKTIAVLGWGINIPFEEADEKLAAEIISHDGLFFSEWEDQRATLWTFPMRNRIVVALCSEVIVIEAAVKSGSLITAKIANKLKRKLWAVPGPITSKTSAGTNALIADGEAIMWAGIQMKNESDKKSSDPLLKALQNEPLTTNELARTLHKSVSEVGAQLSLFAITGEVIEREGKYYVS
ncbi:MAG TPA: DNA-processing protein DprA [Patescibacteria group bacterium]|nr:DNA-processing protein DprA [Patescibacteria group bacterium]